MKLLGTVTVETRENNVTGPRFDNVFPQVCAAGKIYAKGVSVY